MAKRKNYKTESEPEPEVEERKPIVIMKPYIDTITADTIPDKIDRKKLPETIMVRFRGDPMGNKANRYLGKSGTRYDFNGGVPMAVKNDIDKVAFILKARKNPDTWEIVN